MHTITPLERHKTPFPRPQAIASDGHRLWIGSVETQRIYALDPADFSILEEYPAPGKPWGMACVANELRVLCGETDEDHRLIRRVIPGRGFQDNPLPCPEDTGSHLGYDGERLYVSQWYNRRLLALDTLGGITRTYRSPHDIAGHVIVGGNAYLLGTDDEANPPYWITRLNLETGEATDVAQLPFHQARGLAFDGKRFWTNLRELGETIAFSLT